MSSIIRKKGFTFIELLAVVAVLGVMAGVSWPQLEKSYQFWQVKNFSKKIATGIIFWQNRAMAENKVYNMSFKQGPSRLEIRVQGAEDVVKRYEPPRGLDLEMDNFEVLLYPDGSMDPARIEISNRDGGKKTVFIRGAGYVKVQE